MVENGEKTQNMRENLLENGSMSMNVTLALRKALVIPHHLQQHHRVETIDKESHVVDESPTPATSVTMSSTNHVEHLNETTPPIVPDNRDESPEHVTISEELESQLAATVNRIVEQVIVSFKENMQKEFQLLKTTIVALTNRVSELEEKIAINTTDHSETEETQPANNTVIAVSSNIEEHQQQLQLLQSQVQSLSMQQKITEREKEREKRKCNVLLGNIEEKHSESAVDAVLQVFKDKLKVDLSPVNAVRLGKFRDGKRRLILVQMRNSEEKLTLLKKGKLLSGTGIFLADDLSKEERKRRKVLVSEMKKARGEGKRAFIRFSDGELIVNGKPYKVAAECDLISPRVLVIPPTTTRT